MGKHSAHAPRPRVTIRSLVVASLVLAGAVVIATAGAGGTYALLSAGAPIGSGATVTAGSSSLTVNGGATYAAGNLAGSGLGPGASAVMPVTVKNTGTTPLSVTASTTSVVSAGSSVALADSLTLLFAPVASTGACVAGLTGGSSGALIGFVTATPLALAVGQSAVVCVKISVNSAAPSSVQGGTTSFTLLLDAIQVPS